MRHDRGIKCQASPGVLSYRFGDMIDVMSQGKVAMTIMYGPDWARLEDAEYKEKVPAADAQADALGNATIQPNISQLPQVNEILAKYIHAGISGEMSPADAFAKAEAEVNALMK